MNPTPCRPEIPRRRFLRTTAAALLSRMARGRGPAGVCLLLPFDKDLKQYWGLTRLEFQIHSVPNTHRFVDRFSAAKR